MAGCCCETCLNFDDPSQVGTPVEQSTRIVPSQIMAASSSSTPPRRVVHDLELAKSLSSSPLIKPSAELLFSLRAVTAGSYKSSTGNGRRKHRGKETSIAFGSQVRTPGIPRHISGNQMITIQGSQQDTDAFNTSTTVPTYFAQNFTLGSNLNNYAAYTALFDEYKIDMVEAWMTPPGLASAASTVRGEYSSAVDYDDANTPSTVATVSDKQNSLTTTIDQAHYHKFVPKFAVAAYSGTFASYSSDTGWLDCASPNVQHYGLKAACSPTAGGIEYIQVVYRLTVSFRGPGIS